MLGRPVTWSSYHWFWRESCGSLETIHKTTPTAHTIIYSLVSWTMHGSYWAKDTFKVTAACKMELKVKRVRTRTHLLLVWVKFAKLRKKDSSGPYEQTSHWLPLLTNVKWKWKWKHTNFRYNSLAYLDDQSLEAVTTGFDGRAAGP